MNGWMGRILDINLGDGSITNFSTQTTRRVDMVFGIGYGDDIKKAREKGLPNHQITQNLTNNGWTTNTIAAAFQMARNGA